MKKQLLVCHPSGASGAPLNGAGPLIDGKMELLLKLLGCNEGRFTSRASERSLERKKKRGKKSLFFSGPGFSSSNSLLMEQEDGALAL